MYIYKITNKINGKSYIGQTSCSIEKRWDRHCLKGNSKRMYISNAIKKYGKENFIIEEIGGANNQSELNYQEWLLIYKHETLWPNGYNLREGGNFKGVSEKTRKKLSEKAKKRKPRVGYKHSQSTKDKISKSNKGKRKLLTKNEKEKESILRGGKPFSVYKIETNEDYNKFGGRKYKITKKTFMGTWINQRGCARDLGLCPKKVNSCLNGHQKTHKKHMFEYK